MAILYFVSRDNSVLTRLGTSALIAAAGIPGGIIAGLIWCRATSVCVTIEGIRKTEWFGVVKSTVRFEEIVALGMEWGPPDYIVIKADSNELKINAGIYKDEQKRQILAAILQWNSDIEVGDWVYSFAGRPEDEDPELVRQHEA